MIYPDKRGVILMGEKGFIGNALSKHRDHLPPAVYFFNSPSSNILFDKELDWCMSETINDFLQVVRYCRDNKTLLVFPSSATIYNKNTSYARCKAILEEIVLSYGIKFIGLRISAGYGPGEKHKGEYASVVYQWCQEMSKGCSPVIFGDGTQTRDFIYEDDIAETICDLANKEDTGFHDVGTGVNTSFNELVAIINKVLGKNIKPTCVPKPAKYVPETKVNSVPTKYTLEDGIKRILESKI